MTDTKTRSEEFAQVAQLFDRIRAKQPTFKIQEKFSCEWVMHQSDWPWLFLDLKVPHAEMLNEAMAIREFFVPHREYDEKAGYRHRGWQSICLHGVEATKTENFSAYGFESLETTPHRWTEVADRCPVTVEFLKNIFPFEKYYRVRFMLLEPGGFIAPHRDQLESGFFPCNIALNQPDGCEFGMERQGILPIKAGTAFLPNLSNIHFVQNQSPVTRIHLIIHGRAGTKLPQLEELVVRSANLQIARMKNGMLLT